MFWRLFGTFSLLLLFAIGLVGVVIVGRVERHFLSQIEDSLCTKAILVREVTRDRPTAELAHMQERIVALRREIATRITLLDDAGQVLADSEEDPARMDNH